MNWMYSFLRGDKAALRYMIGWIVRFYEENKRAPTVDEFETRMSRRWE